MTAIARLLRAWETCATLVLLPALAALVAVDVALRYLFSLPLQWGSDVKELLLLLLVTAGLPGTSLAAEHIRVGLLDDRLKPRAQRGAERVRHGLAGAVMLFVAYAVAGLAADMFRYGDRAELIAIPFWPVAAAVAVFALLSALAEFLRAAMAGKDPDSWTP